MTTDVCALPSLAGSTYTHQDLPAPPSQRTCDRFLRNDRMLLGRQGIFTGSGDVFGYELFFRSPYPAPLHVDHWTQDQQNHATAHVLHATFAGPYLPEQRVVEIVESVVADSAVIAGVRRLRERGFRIAIDDFVGLASQRRLLPFADYVKIDVRDLDVEGHPLIDLARSYGAQVVAECVESEAMPAECQTLGFDRYQGFALEVTQMLDRTTVLPSQRCG